MGAITIERAENSDLDWINARYKEIGFAESNFDNEFIIFARVENQKAGLGRLVVIDEKNIELGGIYVFPSFRRLGVAERIVGFLCKENPFEKSTVWCLPFDNLLAFYAKFGFEQYKDESVPVPDKVRKKFEWCNSDGVYEKEVLLLFK